MMKEEYNDRERMPLGIMETEDGDHALRQLFEDFHPEMTGGGEFMHRLQTRLDAIEYVSRLQAREKKRSRLAMLCAFGGGLTVGCALYAVLIPGDTSMPSTAVETQFVLLRIISEYSHLFAYLIFSIIALAGILMATSLWQDMGSLRDARDMASSRQADHGAC